MSKINVEGSEISIIAIDNRDYISLTDMVRNIENGSALIEKWLRNKNTAPTKSAKKPNRNTCRITFLYF